MAPMLLRITDAARLIGVSRTTAYRMLESGELPCVRFRRSVRIPRAALETWIRGLSDDSAA